ncbi:hypothetical protein NFI96_027278 [Prochilodus magdalenae]|nr:hypothetical protein NFI96_027278 [Prochilodus magdalenae]
MGHSQELSEFQCGTGVGWHLCNRFRLRFSSVHVTIIHTALTHLEGKDTYVRMLFIDYRSAFNTVIPTKLAGKLLTLGLTPRLCNWVLNFLTDRPQSVRISSPTSSTRTVSTGTPRAVC